MNLDDLKVQLNSKLEEHQSFEMVVESSAGFQKIASTSIAQKIKNSLITEIVFGIIIMMVFLYVTAFSRFHSIKIYFGAFTVLIFLFNILLVFLLKKTNDLTASCLPVVQNLKSLHILLSEFVKRYFQFTMLLIPICLIFSGYLGYSDAQKNINSFDLLPDALDVKKQLGIILFCVALFVVGMFYFTKWYLKKLYGNHLKELEKMIEQLES